MKGIEITPNLTVEVSLSTAEILSDLSYPAAAPDAGAGA